MTAPYAAGRHALDLCLADGEGGQRFIGVETVMHPDGPHAHVRRHVELARNGWPVVTAPRAVWGDRSAELGLRLRQALTGH
ncbi:hypothetical protein BH23ACT9_BH23ACT9_07760 [soil metagenome]